MQKNAGEKPLRWLGKTNLWNKNSTPTGRCQAETDKFAGVNSFDAENDLHFLCRGGGSNNEIFFKISENAQIPWQRQQQGVLFWQKDRWEAAFYKAES